MCPNEHIPAGRATLLQAQSAQDVFHKHRTRENGIAEKTQVNNRLLYSHYKCSAVSPFRFFLECLLMFCSNVFKPPRLKQCPCYCHTNTKRGVVKRISIINI